jgi:hypothetical protein
MQVVSLRIIFIVSSSMCRQGRLLQLLCYCASLNLSVVVTGIVPERYIVTTQNRNQQQSWTTRRQSLVRFGNIIAGSTGWCSTTVKFTETDAAAAMPNGLVIGQQTSASDRDFILSTQLGRSRIGTMDASFLRQPLHLHKNVIEGFFQSNKEPVYYPKFLFGAWNVTATLRRIGVVSDLDGITLHDELSVVELDRRIDDSYQFEVQFFSTLANNWENQLAVNLGTGIPESKIIANRQYNLPSELLLVGFKPTPLTLTADFPNNINWDYRSGTAPTRLTWDDPFVSRRQYLREVLTYDSETTTTNQKCFAVSERHRIRTFEFNSIVQRTTIPLQMVSERETETITEYHQVSDDYVRAVSRNVVPCATGSTIVLDYDVSMRRIDTPFTNAILDDANSTRTITNRPCVETPKGIVQCF